MPNFNQDKIDNTKKIGIHSSSNKFFCLFGTHRHLGHENIHDMI